MESDRLIRRPELVDTIGLTERQIRNLENRGLFPPRVLIAPDGRAVGWSFNQIQAWVAARLAAREKPKKPGMLISNPADAAE